MPIDKRKSLQRAKDFLAEITEDNFRYAALELRLCMEELTYQKLRGFSREIPEKVLNTWQPPQAVRALLEFEPDADKSYSLTIRREGADGQPEGPPVLMGTHNALGVGWLRKHYNKVGNLLHAPGPGKPTGKSLAEIEGYLKDVVAALEDPVSSNITGGSIRAVYTIQCVKCGQTVVANKEAALKSQRAECFNPACKASYVGEVVNGEIDAFALDTVPCECAGENCGETIEVERALMKPDLEFKCPKCGKGYRITGQHWEYGAALKV